MSVSFLEAIRADPDDDTPRLVFADWLDENKQPDRAALIRTQIERDRLAADDDRQSDLQARELRLLAANVGQ